MNTVLHKREFFILSVFLTVLMAFAFSGCDNGYNPGGCNGAYPTPTPTPGTTPDPTPNPNEPAEFQLSPYGKGYGNYVSSAHFRVYTRNTSTSSANKIMEHLEAVYKLFITDWGFRTTGLSRMDPQNKGPYYKTDVVISPALSMGGAAGLFHENEDTNCGWLEIGSPYVNDVRVFVHEFGHVISLHQINWVEHPSCGAWWETFANWVADTYMTSSYCKSGGYTLIDLAGALDKVPGQSYVLIVNASGDTKYQNYYEAWPFFTYLTNNPDNYPTLGKTTLAKMNSVKLAIDETPLQALERIASPVSVQTILGRYWAHMAYMDIGHPMAQKVYFDQRGRLDFNNLDNYGSQTYRVKAARRPMYGGANIIPLRVTGSSVSVQVTNLGNGWPNSNFTATLAIRASNGSVRYVDLPNGSGQATVGGNEEASLVVVNTPDALIKYNAFNSTANSEEKTGLNYEVRITGATPTN